MTVKVTATPKNLGAYRLDIQYDSALVSATACTSAFGTCSIDANTSTVRVEGSSQSGITGTNLELGTITFLAGSKTGTAALTIAAGTLSLSDTAGEVLNIVAVNGAITISTATATPASVPSSGGAPGTSGTNSVAWLLAAAAVVLVAGGGAWVIPRARREN